jgi:hypothetical protein
VAENLFALFILLASAPQCIAVADLQWEKNGVPTGHGDRPKSNGRAWAPASVASIQELLEALANFVLLLTLLWLGKFLSPTALKLLPRSVVCRVISLSYTLLAVLLLVPSLVKAASTNQAHMIVCRAHLKREPKNHTHSCQGHNRYLRTKVALMLLFFIYVCPKNRHC